VKINVYKVGSWEVNYLSGNEVVLNTLISRVEKFLNSKWQNAVFEHPCENRAHLWAGFKDLNILTPVLRFEMSPLDLLGGIENRIYSIGKRPGLIGVLAEIVRQFPEHRTQIMETLAYKFSGIIQLGSFVQDDLLLAEKILKIPYFTEIPKDTEGQYYWVRTDPHTEYPEELLEKLESISLVPVRADGCNSEFMPLKMARRLSEILPQHLPWYNIEHDSVLLKLFEEALPWNTSFVVKPVQGTWGENVCIYHLEDMDEERMTVWNEIKNLVRMFGPHKFMIQPYIPDRMVERGGKIYHELFRLYFAYLGKGKYTFTGGMVQGSRSRKVCGVKDTYFIPIFTD
jgi:hypothetical protein